MTAANEQVARQALVDYPLTDLQHVKRVGKRWCIGDFGIARRIQKEEDVETVNERNLHLFTEALLGAVVTTRVENGVCALIF